MSLFQIDYDSGFCGDDYPVIEIPGSKSVAARRLIIDYIRGGGSGICEYAPL